MKTNEGTIDRVIRVLIGIGLLLAAFAALGVLDGAPLGIVAAIVGAVALMTGVIGFCPAYMLLGFKTCPLKK